MANNTHICLIAGQIQHQVGRLVLCRRPVGDTDIRA